jgi:hypothetical protein
MTTQHVHLHLSADCLARLRTLAGGERKLSRYLTELTYREYERRTTDCSQTVTLVAKKQS